jgi:NTE family protein
MPTIQLPEKIRVALVLGGGGVRGMAHVGVLDEFEKEGIPIDLIVGCSAGSIVGAFYAHHPNCDEIKQAVDGFKTQSIFDIDIFDCRWGISRGKSLNKMLHGYLGDCTFEELRIPLIVVATDLNSGELVPMGSGDVVSAVQASCSLPFIFVPCEHMGRILIDGGVVNPVPVDVARDLGAEIIIAVDLCELLDKTFPTNLFGVLNRSAEIAFMWQNETCNHNADVKIFPKSCGVGSFGDKYKRELYEAGRMAAREQMPKIKELLANSTTILSPLKREVDLSCYVPGINKEYEEERVAQLREGEQIADNASQSQESVRL